MNQHEIPKIFTVKQDEIRNMYMSENGQSLDSLMAQLAHARLHLKERVDDAQIRLRAEFAKGRDVSWHRVAEGIRLDTQVADLTWALEMLPDLSMPPARRDQERAGMTVGYLSGALADARALFQNRIVEITSSLARGDFSLARIPRDGKDALAELTTTVALLYQVLQIVPRPPAANQQMPDARLELAARIAAAFPGFVGDEEVNGADLVNWVNEELGLELAVVRDGGKMPQWGCASNPQGARRFFTELEEHVTTLDGIADRYGSHTLASLMYLQNAIASCGHIDHYVGESSLLEVLKLMPSAERWMRHVEVREPEVV
jgi:hypothetical protein